MIGVYLAALLFGGILLSAAMFLGGHGHSDADHELGHDHGDLDHDHGDLDPDHGDLDHDPADLDHDHGPTDLIPHRAADSKLRLPFLSVRFWSYCTAAFGANGLILTLGDVNPLLTAAISLVFGVAIGSGAAWFFQRLQTDTVSGETSLDRLQGQEAQVVLPIRPHDTGKIVVKTAGGRFDLAAVSKDGRVLEVGEAVLIASITDGVADVTALARAPRTLTDRERSV